MADASQSGQDTPAVTGPRYRYFQAMPATVRLRVASFCENVPRSAWRGSEKDRERVIELLCEDVFEANVPRIRLANLAKSAPMYFDASLEPDKWVVLPAAALALQYQPATRRELIGESGFGMTPPPEASGASNNLAISEFGSEKPVTVQAETETATSDITAEEMAADQSQAGERSEPGSQDTARIAPLAFPPSGTSIFAGMLQGQQSLQELFLTEEDLTLLKVVESTAKLPGIEACALALGESVIASTASPVDLDLRAIAERADRFLRYACDLPLKAELRLSDALTVYSGRGPFSFLREGRLCLTVVHRGKGFVPGVREKLACLLKALAEQIPETPIGGPNISERQDLSIASELRDEVPL